MSIQAGRFAVSLITPTLEVVQLLSFSIARVYEHEFTLPAAPSESNKPERGTRE